MREGATAGAGRKAEHAAPHTLQVIVLVERILRRLGDVHGVQTHAGALQIKVTQILVLLVLLLLRLLGSLLLEARPLLLHLKHSHVSTSNIIRFGQKSNNYRNSRHHDNQYARQI